MAPRKRTYEELLKKMIVLKREQKRMKKALKAWQDNYQLFIGDDLRDYIRGHFHGCPKIDA